MSVFAYNNERPFFTEANGAPLDSGYVYIGTAGLDPRTNPIVVYWDEAMTVPALQPLRTSAGSIVRNGTRAAVFISDETFSLRVENKSRVLVDAVAETSMTTYGEFAASTGADIVGYQQGSAGSVVQTVGDKLRQFLTPEDFGADGVGDDTSALQAAFIAAGATGKPLLLADTKIYSFTQLTISEGASVLGKGATLRIIPTLTGSSVSITVEDDVKADGLTISTPGTETNLYLMNIGSDCRIGEIKIDADTQRAATAVTVTGSDTRIDSLVTRNIDRPIHFDGSASPSPTTGNHLGLLDCESFVRGFRATNCDKWSFGGYRMYGRSPNASYTQGHNGILITDSKDWQVGEGTIYQPGEHAIRISGETRACQNGKFGSVTVDSSGGCAFKINPYSLYRATNIVCDGVYGIDIGDFTEFGAGDNKEVVRISHADKVRIGFIYGDTRTETKSGQYALKLNDCTNVTIDTVGGNNVNAGIHFDKDADVDAPNRSAGPVTNVTINNYCATIAGFGSAVSVSMDGQTIGDIAIHFNGAKGWTNYIANFNGTPTVSGPIYFTGTIGGSVVPSINNRPASLVYMNAFYRGTVYN